jgi:hypothetical protein
LKIKELGTFDSVDQYVISRLMVMREKKMNCGGWTEKNEFFFILLPN